MPPARTASSSSPSGATMTSSSSPAAAPTTSPGSVARQSDSSTVILRPAGDRASCSPGGAQRARQVGRPEATQREHGVDDRLDGVAGGPATWRRPRPCRTTAPSSPSGRGTRPRPRPPRTWRAGGRSIEPLRSTSRQIAVAGCRPARGPADARDRRPHRPHGAATIASRLASTSRSPRSGRYGRSANRPVPRGRRATPGDVEEQPPGEPPGQLAEPGVGRAGQVGEHRQHVVGVVVQRRRRRPPRRARRRPARSARSRGCARARAATSSASAPSSTASSASSPSLVGGDQGELVAPSGRQLFPRLTVPDVATAEHLLPQLGDDLLGRAAAALAQPHPAGQGDECGVEATRR